MAIEIGIPSSESVVDRQFIEIPGPDGTTTSYQYDKETNTMIRKESQVIIPSFHGHTHTTEDPIPESTPFLRGLQSAEDKARFDAMTQTRLGVLGFQGAGFPDDGGFLQGDVLLAAGSEFISIERVGNVVRFTVDSPVPLACNCEECAQIYWIQDESETRAVRPPSCNGIMPDMTGYGEFKIYAYPESSLFNPNKALEFFENKGTVPAFIFKRYENGNETNTAEQHIILKRREDSTTNVGWSMTPGSNGFIENIWFVGNDRDGRQQTFEMLPEMEPELLGSILYNGHTITRQNAVVTGYSDTVLDTNLYLVKKWSVNVGQAVGEEFNAQNIWQYNNPEGGDATPETLILDKTIQLLEVGEVIEIYQFQTGTDEDGQPMFMSYFSKKPSLNPNNIWSPSGGVKFGDLQEQRKELNFRPSITGTDNLGAVVSDVPDIRLFEKTEWGITNFENPVIVSDDGEANTVGEYEPSGTLVNNRLQAKVDYSIPGLVVTETPKDLRGDINGNGVVDNEDLSILMDNMGKTDADTDFNEDADLNKDGVVDVRDLNILATNLNVEAEGVIDRPVWLWDRSTHGNFIMKAKIGMPTDEISNFPPIDFVVGGPIDHVQDVYIKVVERGIYETGPYANLPFIKVEGVNWDTLPTNGSIRILTGVYRDIIWQYQYKVFDGDVTILVGFEDIFPFDEDFIISYNASVTGGSVISDLTALTNVTGITDVTAEEMPSTPTNTVVTELLHSDYTTSAVRLSFTINRTEGAESVQLQVISGLLSMSTPYSLDDDAPDDDYVRGFLPGEFTISDSLNQVGFITDGMGTDVPSQPDGFRVYDGGFLPAPIGDETEKWNDLEIMKRGNQIWVWWNGFLVTPSPQESSQLPVPVAVSSPYFPAREDMVSKIGLRMFPGSKVREVTVSDQNFGFNEYVRGQLKIDCS